MTAIKESESQFYGPVSVCGYPDHMLDVRPQIKRASVRKVKPILHPGIEAKIRAYEQSKHSFKG